VKDNRQYAPYDAPGAIFYNTNQYKSKGLVMGLQGTVFTEKALVPAMDWKATDSLAAPTGLTLTGKTLSWTHPSDSIRYSVYVYPKGYDSRYYTSSMYLYDIAWGKQIDLSRAGDLSQKSIIVCAYDRFGNEFAPAYYNRSETEIVDTIDVHVTGIRMRLTETRLKAGATVTMNPTVSPNNATVKTVLWESSDATVAEVSAEGVVTGVNNGTAVITGTTLDGGYQVQCTVTVYGGTGLTQPEGVDVPSLIRVNGQWFIERRVGDEVQRYTLSGQRVQ